jgi:CRP-like cAMP-binding protein
MKVQQYLKKEIIIKYGDVGGSYFILSKGNVKVTVYKKGTPADDPNLESHK